MQYAIELNFDKQTTEKIYKLWKVLVENNLAKEQTKKRPYVPHISLAVTPKLDTERYKTIVEEYAKNNSSLDILIVSLGLFRDETNVLFLAPQVNLSLLKINSDFHQQFCIDNIENWHYYHPNRWVPHCSITFNSSFEQIMKSLTLCENLKLPFMAKIDKLSLVDFKNGEDIHIANFSS